VQILFVSPGLSCPGAAAAIAAYSSEAMSGFRDAGHQHHVLTWRDGQGHTRNLYAVQVRAPAALDLFSTKRTDPEHEPKVGSQSHVRVGGFLENLKIPSQPIAGC